MSIKLATEWELHIVREITRETIKEIYPHYYPAGAVKFFLDYHSDENISEDIAAGRVFLLEENGMYMGTVTIKENDIGRLFVLPQYQKRGYGKALLDFAEAKVFERFDEVVLSASLPAKSIYLKRGYVETEYHTLACENGDFLCFDLMKRKKQKQINS